MRYRKLTALLLLTALLSGCGTNGFEEPSENDISMPTPEPQIVAGPYGDFSTEYSQRATMYYVSSDGQLASTLRLLRIPSESRKYETLMQALLEKPYSSSGLSEIAPADTRILEIDYTSGIATVNVSAQVLSEGEEAFYVARSAIAKTLLEIREVKAVNVIVEGRAVEINGVPVGAVTKQSSDIETQYVQMMSEQVLIENDKGYVDRDIIVYLPAGDGFVCPIAMEIKLTDVNYSLAVAERFVQAAVEIGYAEETLDDISVDTYVTTEGRRIASIMLPKELQGDPVVPALMLTVGSFIPYIDQIELKTDGENWQSVGSLAADEIGGFTMSQLRSVIGSIVRLYLPQADGTLLETQAVTAGFEPTARSVLRCLIREGAFPAGAAESDILGIGIENDIAAVNLSSLLYSACQSFTISQERAFIYSIVNTLAENFETIKQVQFYVAGERITTLCGNIHIDTPLMPNPGIVKENNN